MWRVLVAELKQETATFNPVRTRYDDFHVAVGTEILAAYGGSATELAGAMELLAADGRVEIVPTFAADAVSGGPVATPDLDRLLAMMLEAIGAAVALGAVDGIYICFHGAMAGEEEGDPEGKVLTQIRAMVGALPIVVSLDLHAIISERLVAAADILVPFHTYPHVDHFETGQRAARNLIRMLEGAVKPVTVRIELPMLVRGDELITTPDNPGLFAEAIRLCREIEAPIEHWAGLAAGVIIGNPFTDVADLQSNVLVTTDNDLPYAQEKALEIARFMWQNRERFRAALTPLDEAIRIAEQAVGQMGGLTIFSDAADATASGASGDSNVILKGLVEAAFAGQALVPIVDHAAVAAAFAAGVGATIAVPLGGTRDPGVSPPLSSPPLSKACTMAALPMKTAWPRMPGGWLSCAPATSRSWSPSAAFTWWGAGSSRPSAWIRQILTWSWSNPPMAFAPITMPSPAALWRLTSPALRVQTYSRCLIRSACAPSFPWMRMCNRRSCKSETSLRHGAEQI